MASYFTQIIRLWFPWVAGILLFLGIQLVGYVVFTAARGGGFSWMPYPLFALFCILILAANWLIYSDPEG